MYPSASNFASASPASAWWTVQVSGNTVVCSTTGNEFIRQLQQRLGVSVDGSWGPATSTALSRALKAANAPAAFVTAVDADATTRTLRIGSLIGAVWLLHRAALGPVPAGVTPSALSLQGGTVLPTWSHAPPKASSGTGITCSALASQNPAPAPAPSPAPVPSSDATPAPTLLPLPVTNVQSSLPPGVSLLPQSRPYATWPAVALIVGVSVVGVALAVVLTKPPAVARANPRKRSRRRR
jgi:hypothetical protein